MSRAGVWVWIMQKTDHGHGPFDGIELFGVGVQCRLFHLTRPWKGRKKKI